LATAAASAPLAEPPIGASAIGLSTPNRPVNAVCRLVSSVRRWDGGISRSFPVACHFLAGSAIVRIYIRQIFAEYALELCLVPRLVFQMPEEEVQSLPVLLHDFRSSPNPNPAILTFGVEARGSVRSSGKVLHDRRGALRTIEHALGEYLSNARLGLAV